MINALRDAGVANYYPTSHTIERLALRFGIDSDKAVEWINDKMKGAKLITKQHQGRRLVYEADDIRIVISEKDNAVITVHHAMRLDFLRPALEREIRKIRREYTRSIRASERHAAQLYAKLSEQMSNYANAKNPNTRALIGGRMEETERHIEGTRRKIERLKDEVKAKVKAIEVIAE